MGWKDTVRMNPLEDILVALQPITPILPWPIQNSVRLNDITGAGNMFTNLNPFSNNPAATADGPTNFGWEYVWHCHILGHEENDMMRPIMFQVPPPAPSNLLASSNNTGGVNLTWTDNSANETGFVLQRDVDPAFGTTPPTLIPVPTPNTNKNLAQEGTDWGGQVGYTDTDSTLVSGTTYYYRVQAVDDGFKTSYEQTYNVTSPLYSIWSNSASIATAPFGSIAPTSLAFGNVTVSVTAITLTNGQLAQVTISNTGNGSLTLSAPVQSGSSDFASTASSCSTVAAGGTCVFDVTYKPTTVGFAAATITFTTNDNVHPTLSVSMTGAGVVNTAIAILASTVTYNADGVVTLTLTSTPIGVPTGNVTLVVDGGTPISQALTVGATSSTATFTLTAPKAGTHTLLAAYATQGGFQGSSANGTLTVNQPSLTISPTPNPATMSYGGPLPALTPSYNAFVAGEGPANLTGTATCSTTATATSPVGPYTSVCAGATSMNYAISYPQGVVNVVKAMSTATITSNRPSLAIVGQVVTVGFSVAPQFSGTPTGSVTVTASTGETCSGALTAGAGSCTLAFATGGSRTLTAVYSGDGSFLASPASTAVTQLVSNISVSTTALLFGNQLVGTTSAAQTVTLANVGTTTLTGISFAWSGNFSDSTTCGTSLAPGRSCRINVRFRPTSTGVLTGTLTITNSDPTSPQIVALTGTGVQPAAVLSPTSFGFGTVTRGSSSSFAFTLSNPGNMALTINAISFNGTNAPQFSQTNNCGASLGAGASCTINVTFAPTRRGALSANLRVADNAPASPQLAALTGTGQ
jgi:hypothetical protein